MTEKRFPILRSGRDKHPFKWVPWDVIEAHRKQAEKNHLQTLERLAQRGGLSASELYLALEDRALYDRAGHDTLTEKERWAELEKLGIARLAEIHEEEDRHE